MSYASLLSLLAVLSFGLPFLARLAERVGVPRSYSVVLSLALGIFAGTYAWLRWYLRDQDVAVATEDMEPGVLPEETYIPEFFFHEGEFQGDRLLAQGHRDAALKMYEAYRALLARQGHTTAEVDKMIRQLELSEEEQSASL